MLELGFAIAALLSAQPQAATLEGCDFVENRWICRYRLPEIQLVGSPPTTAIVPSSEPPPATAAVVGAEVAAVVPVARDRGVLTESESELVARCAEARWLSLCLPSQRVEARRLRDEAQAYEAARLRVGELITGGDCEGALGHALSNGYFGLARESQTFCAPSEAADQ